MADDDNLPGRVRRYARVSTAMGGLAARLAGERYLGMPLDKARHAADLTRGAGRHQGAADEGGAASRHHPRRAAPGICQRARGSCRRTRRRWAGPSCAAAWRAELGPDWQKRFASFEHEAARAASLGQVHRATALDGRRLACKLQYPDMASAVEADLRQLKLVMSLYERYDRAITTDEIHAEIAERLREELDYAREAAHMRLYRRILADDAGAWPCPSRCRSCRRRGC